MSALLSGWEGRGEGRGGEGWEERGEGWEERGEGGRGRGAGTPIYGLYGMVFQSKFKNTKEGGRVQDVCPKHG